MDNKDLTFLFVICFNDDQLLDQCKRHIEQLQVPPLFQVRIQPIQYASSLTSAYNLILSYPAKYKIYLHQDTFIVDTRLLYHLLLLFAGNRDLGLLGLAGSTDMPANGIWWESSQRAGQVIEYRNRCYRLLEFPLSTNQPQGYLPAAAVDGFFMATQYDVRWREDLFRGFHFYDVSQSYEFIRAGYTVGIAHQESPWCIHFNGDGFDQPAYEADRLTFVKHYLEQQPDDPDDVIG